MCEEFVWNHIVVCILDGKLSKNLQMLDTLTLKEATNRVKSSELVLDQQRVTRHDVLEKNILK